MKNPVWSVISPVDSSTTSSISKPIVRQCLKSCFISVMINTGNTPIFCAFTANSIDVVLLPVLERPLTIVMCPIGHPGTDNASCRAGEKGIQRCSLNFTLDANPLLCLNLSKLKFALIAWSAAADSDCLPLAITLF